MTKTELDAAVNARLAEINTALDLLPDGTAACVSTLFDEWQPDTDYAEGKRLRYGPEDTLYKVRQAHTSQADWTPDKTPALYEEIPKPGQGDDPSNPIPYNNNMALVNGKFYSQRGVVYRCFRDTGVPVYNDLADLVGLYVEVWT